MTKVFNWQEKARCRLHPDSPTLFFPVGDHEPSIQRRKREIKAKTLCKFCDVQNSCLEYAMENVELVGVWGGTNEKERKQKRIIREIEILGLG